MYLVYSILYSLAFLLLIPRFLFQREKYASGFSQRLGKYPEFEQDDRKVIWLHCVSVGETNAARPLVDQLIENFPDNRLIISTITKTGQELAQKIFEDKADAIFYFPFDWKFTVRRALHRFKPSVVLLMETEIWPRFIHEAKQNGAKVAIVNGRMSERSLDRYRRIRTFVERVLEDVERVGMQDKESATRFVTLGLTSSKVVVTGNLKFEQSFEPADQAIKEELRSRFGISAEMPLVIAASTHDPEEIYVIDALRDELGATCRLLIAPRHPERFDAVEKILRASSYSFARKTWPASKADASVDIILLDTIGDLRAAYSLAEIVFVGGSLVEHGGQSVLEPAAAGRAIVTGPYTHNFDSVVSEFREKQALLQLPMDSDDVDMFAELRCELTDLIENEQKRSLLGQIAKTIMERGQQASNKTMEMIRELLPE